MQPVPVQQPKLRIRGCRKLGVCLPSSSSMSSGRAVVRGRLVGLTGGRVGLLVVLVGRGVMAAEAVVGGIKIGGLGVEPEVEPEFEPELEPELEPEFVPVEIVESSVESESSPPIPIK